MVRNKFYYGTIEAEITSGPKRGTVISAPFYIFAPDLDTALTEGLRVLGSKSGQPIADRKSRLAERAITSLAKEIRGQLQ